MKKTIIISLLTLATCSVYAQSPDGPVKINTVNNAVCNKAPHMPASAVPVFPKTAYTPTQDPLCAPCYEYKTKHGLEVMECPFLWFPPENGATTTGGGTAQIDDDINIQSQRSYTGNYQACKRDPHMPANAKAAWPQSPYTPIGSPACAPCYEYTTKHGLKVMECPNLYFPAENQ